MYSKKFLKKYKINPPEFEEPVGFVYIIKNGERYKIGKTKKDPSIRKKNLTLGEAGTLIYFCKYKNYHHKEKEWHLLMKDKRILNSEWFEDLDELDLLKLKGWKINDRV